jgi:RNA polymerase sigma-70 factor, ECF subfamily
MGKKAMVEARGGAISLDEAMMVEQARAGDMAAFSRLVSRYQDRILNTCWRLCGNLEDAQDLCQEAFLHALKAIRGFQQQAQFYTWLFRIAVNLSISQRRKAARAPRLSLHDADGDCLADEPQARIAGRIDREPQEPAAQLSAREIHDRVLRELEGLDDDHRAVVVLRDIEGFDYQQIAEILEVAVGTVKSRLHRARLELRQRLGPIVAAEV